MSRLAAIALVVGLVCPNAWGQPTVPSHGSGFPETAPTRQGQVDPQKCGTSDAQKEPTDSVTVVNPSLYKLGSGNGAEPAKSYDKENLNVYTRAAEAAESQALASWLGFASGIIVTMLVWMTFRETQKQVVASERQATIAIQNARPYVFFFRTVKKSDDDVSHPNSGYENVLGFNLMNHGSTPAFVSKIKHNVGVFSTNMPPSAALIPESESVEMPRGSVLSGGELWPRKAHRHSSITQEMVDEVNADQSKMIYLYGEITYRDAFIGADTTYKTRFCRYFNGNQFVVGNLSDPKQNDYS